ncbi:hypothetical protein D3C81_2213000 [compost metagenome]
MAIRSNQTFIGGYPQYYKALFEEYPNLKTLFVPVTQLREAQKQIQKTGTALNMAFQSLKGV